MVHCASARPTEDHPKETKEKSSFGLTSNSIIVYTMLIR